MSNEKVLNIISWLILPYLAYEYFYRLTNARKLQNDNDFYMHLIVYKIKTWTSFAYTPNVLNIKHKNGKSYVLDIYEIFNNTL